MQLRGDRQSRDEGLHGRTQLWASATRQLMSQEDAFVNRRHRRPRHTYTLDSNVKSESRAGPSKIAECALTVQEEAREPGDCGEEEPCSPHRPRPQRRLAHRERSKSGSPSTGMIPRRKAHSPMRRPRRSCGTLSSSNLEAL